MSRAVKLTLVGVLLLLALATVATALLAGFDWNRSKPWINRQVSEALGRDFRIRGELALTWQAMPATGSGWQAWLPWPRLRATDIMLANPDWASTPAMLQAREVVFSVNPLPLLDRRVVIPLLSLDAPQLVLERDAERRSNWHFESQLPSRWRIEVQALAARHASVRLVDAIRHADIGAQADIVRDSLHAAPADKQEIDWQLAGSLNGEALQGTAQTGGMLPLKQADASFPFDAQLRIGDTDIRAQGRLVEPRRAAWFDMRLQLAGPSLSQLHSIFGLVLPQTAAYALDGRLSGTPNPFGGNWRYEKFSGRIGASDIAGTLHYEARVPRSRLEGTLQSEYLNVRDLSPLIGADSRASKARRGDKTVQPAGKLLPVEKFDNSQWNSIDTDIRFSGRRIVRNRRLPVSNLATRIRLHEGVLSLAPLEFGVAGGRVTSSIRLNGTRTPVQGRLQLSARHLKLAQLFPALLSAQAQAGEINAEAALTGYGNSVDALLGSSGGEVRAIVNHGALSRALLEKMGMNLGAMLATELFGDEAVRMDCALADFKVEQGVMRSRVFVVDTEAALLHVEGDIDLGKERLDLTLYPESRGLRLISLQSPLHLTGSFGKPMVEVDRESLALKAGSALALGALAPVAAALIPLIGVGSDDKSECAGLVERARDQPLEAGLARPDGSGP
jgi:uncharacterized protein involved in outer membrane biogenesis